MTYLKCHYCGKETDERDSRPNTIIFHMSCKVKWMAEQGWEEDSNGLGMHKK